MQNRRTLLFNTAARRDFGWPCSCHNSTDKNIPGGHASHIYAGADLQLEDVARLRFWPAAGSPLVDAGEIKPPYTNGGFKGPRPDIGAYERGGAEWTAGCRHATGC